MMINSTNTNSADLRAIAPWRLLQLRLLNVRTLSPLLRGILLMTVGLVIAATVLYIIALVTIPTSDGLTTDDPANMVLAFFIVTTLCSAVGWTLLFAGFYQASSIIRFLLVGGFVVLLGVPPINRLANDSVTFWPLAITVGQLLALAALVAWLIVLTTRQTTIMARSSMTLVVCGCVLGIYFFSDAMLALTGTISVSQTNASTLVNLLPTLFAIVVIWSSTDFIEWGETLTNTVTAWVNRSGRYWLVYTLVGIGAAASLGDMLRRLNVLGLLPGVGVTALLLVGCVGLVRLARVDATWPLDVPLPALLFVAGFLYVIVHFIPLLAHAIVLVGHLAAPVENFILTLIAMTTALGVLGFGLFLLLTRRVAGASPRQASGLLLGITALLIFALNIPQFLNGIGFPLLANLQPSPASFKLIATTGTLLVLVGLLAARRLTRGFTTPFILALVAIAGLQCVGWYYQLFLPNLHAIATQSSVIAAAFLIIAILWDVFFSGDQVTNRESTRFPRDGRVLLYLGYVLNAVVLSLYLIRQPPHGTLSAAAAENSYLEVVGAFGLGVPLVVFTFGRQFALWWQRSRHDEAHGG